MPSYVVTGASRGLGLEFIRQLSSDPNNVVFGLVRSKVDTEKRLAHDATRKNLKILEADLVDAKSLEVAAKSVAELTGGRLDYLIGNGALVSRRSGLKTMSELSKDPQVLADELDDHFKVNVVGNINLINVFLPLVRKGNAKKVVMISSGMADLDIINEAGSTYAGPYAMSKAALNVAVAKYSAEFKHEGILFFSISPGVVDTGNFENLSEEEGKALQNQIAAMASYAPHWTGPISPETSTRMVLDVMDKASVEKGDGGSFVSHHGNKQWL